jgi:opacity protein-like surface antigen
MKKSLIAACAVAVLSIGAAFAQGVQEQPQPSQDTAPRTEHRAAAAQQFNQRFSEADVNGDGMLTREEAAAKLPGIAAHFDQLDTEHKGYLTKRDVLLGMRKMQAERRATQE